MSSMPDRVRELLAAPSLEALSYALRHPEVWPEKYSEAGWHFPSCARCAMGLAHALWPTKISVPDPEDCAPALGITSDQARIFFIVPGHDVCTNRGELVKAGDIADAIDALLLHRAA